MVEFTRVPAPETGKSIDTVTRNLALLIGFYHLRGIEREVSSPQNHIFKHLNIDAVIGSIFNITLANRVHTSKYLRRNLMILTCVFTLFRPIERMTAALDGSDEEALPPRSDGKTELP